MFGEICELKNLLYWVLGTIITHIGAKIQMINSNINQQIRKQHISIIMYTVCALWFLLCLATDIFLLIMMTSSNGNIFRVTDPLLGEFTGDRWIPLTKASDEELLCFLWSAPE